MSKQRKKSQPFNPNDIDILLRARRDGGTVAFENGRPSIISYPPKEYQPRRKGKPDTSQLGEETVSIKPGSLLSPIEDVLMMVDVLELFAAHYSERLSEIEHRREDCTHLLEPWHDGKRKITDFLPDDMILAIGKKLQRIGIERRNTKNHFEVIKTVKRGFSSKAGQDSLMFLRSLLAETAAIIKEQQQRIYTPRTDELDNLFENPLPKYINLKDILPGPTDEPLEYENSTNEMSEERLTWFLHELEKPEGFIATREGGGT